MSRLEFMKRLASLLDDLPREEKIEILKYYNGYFDEAGTENETATIAELGSPEKVAAEVKAGMCDEMGINWMDPEEAANNQDEASANHIDKGSEDSQQTKDANTADKTDYGETPYRQTPRRKETNGCKTIAIVAILMLTFPVWIGLLGGLIGLIGAAVGILIALVVAPIGLIVGLVGAAVGCLVAGAGALFVTPVSGMFSLAVGIFLMGLVLLAGLLVGVVFGKILPLCFTTVKNLVRWIGRLVGGIFDSLTGRR